MSFKPGQPGLPGRRWEPGQSGNPSGRPKAIMAVAQLARQHTTDAIETLVEIMRDTKATASARVSAAKELLDRGHGKAPAEVTIKTDPREMTNLELAQAILADVHSPEQIMAILAILNDGEEIQRTPRPRSPVLEGPSSTPPLLTSTS